VIPFTLGTFLVFNAVLILASGALAFLIAQSMTGAAHGSAARRHLPVAFDDEDEAMPPLPATLPPWGELWVRDRELDRPDEYASFESEPKRPSWSFPATNREQIHSLLSDVGLPSEQIARALGPELSDTFERGIVIHPDLDLLLALGPESRAKLYRILAQNGENRLMRDPFRMRASDVDRWIGHDSFAAQVVELLPRLLYPCGKLMCLADYDIVLQQLSDPQQRIRLAKVLTRKHVLDVRLHVRPDTDIDRMVQYWTHDTRGNDLRTMLESLKRLPRGGTIGIWFALPPFARLRLYTYPVATDRGDDPSLNCHFSTFNFFNETPDERFADWGYASAYLTRHFHRVDSASRLGDRVFLVNGSGVALHSAVYIAEDIVFTKNGNGVGQPWILMHLQDMADYYAYAELLEVLVYRANER
jgi:hypothetical protein